MTQEQAQMFKRLISYAAKIAMNGNGQIAQDIRLCLVDASRYWYLRDDGEGFEVTVRETDEDGGETWVAGYPGKELDVAIDNARSIRTGRVRP